MRRIICILATALLVLPVLSIGDVEKTKNKNVKLAIAVQADNGNLLTQYLDRAEIHPPVILGRLTIFPITLKSVNRLENVLTMSEALEKKLLVVEELPSAQVPKARFTNKSENKMIFLMAGAVIVGGKQNRTLTTDALLGPNSSTVLNVYCVQRGRWTGKKGFEKILIAPQNIRARAMQKAGQGEIWREVARTSRKFKASDPTGDLVVVLSKQEKAKHFTVLRKRIVPKLPEKCVGIVVAKDKKIIGADLFNSPELFTRMKDKVLNAYLGQYTQEELGITAKGGFIVQRPTQKDVRNYLQACYKASFEQGNLHGVGRIYHIRGARYGETLGFENRYMIHTTLMQKIVKKLEGIQNQQAIPVRPNVQIRRRLQRRRGEPR